MRAFTLLACAIFFMTSCGPSKAPGGTTTREREDRDRARQTYSRFVGLYRGHVVPYNGDKRPISVELDLRVVEVSDGRNENGEPGFRLELRGYFLPTDIDLGLIPGARRALFGRFFEDRDELALQNPEPDRGAVSISASFKDGQIDGTIYYFIANPINGRITVQRFRD